jgi:flavin reductase (DIM6/NTAB) family NADH-FMN oxidoreductase RutF
MHKAIDLKVLYFGTPVVLISSRNPDGTTNVAPMSSAWWLGQSCMLGLATTSQTATNLLREKECVLNLAPSTLVDAVDRLAMTTGSPVVPPYKADMGYRYEPDKFGIAGLAELPSQIVSPPRIAQCPIQLECEVVASHTIAGTKAAAIQVNVLRSHVEEGLIIPGTHYVDPIGWDPLIMKFCEFFGGGVNVYPSRLAEGWRMPHPMTVGRSAV